MFARLLGLAIAAAVFAYIFVPYFLGWRGEEGGKPSFLEDSRESLMAQLADLEYDFRTGKLLESDYRQIRNELEWGILESRGEGKDEAGSGG